MLSERQKAALTRCRCSVRLDAATRHLYATDASIYRLTPSAVAFPETARQGVEVIRAAREAGLSVTPRGAGTGLVGGALGEGVVIDFSRHHQRIWDWDVEKETVRVGAGVVLDQLNAYLKPFGYGFGPDVATSSRATLGGMIANNSSGARVAAFGTTADHVRTVEIVTADGEIASVGAGSAEGRARIRPVACAMRAAGSMIRENLPEGLRKRWPGYGLDGFLREPDNLSHLIAGSEGTLAGICSAELKVVRLPEEKGLGLIFFATLSEAMQATVALLDLEPTAIEHVDRILLDQTRGQRAFQRARDLLELDSRPCESLLIVEFFDEVEDRLQSLRDRPLGLRRRIVTRPEDMELVWELRKAGLSLLTGCKGSAKPVTGIEDAAVRPAQLPEYVKGLSGILERLGLRACFYGHAAAGLLHVRPVLDLRQREDLAKFRQVAGEVSALVRQFRGSISGEHGVGMARTEFLSDHFEEGLLRLFRAVKECFDPENLFNPGKVLSDGRFKIDRNLRLGAGYGLELPFVPRLAFAAKDGSFVGNLEQCNGCGGCRKQTPAMCPTFIATGDELMSTRGRANLIRTVLERQEKDGGEGLLSGELDAALSNCLACKACTTECPSNVNLSLLKAELQHAKWRRFGPSGSQRLLSCPDLAGALGSLAPNWVNALQAQPWFRRLLRRRFGISEARRLPALSPDRFDRWFASRSRGVRGSRDRVILWDDTFVRYHEPWIGRAAVAVLEAAGFHVELLGGRRCCGRPAFSQGDLSRAARCGKYNLDRLRASKPDPVVFLEPSCYSMFVEDYLELGLEGAGEVARRCFLWEEFLDPMEGSRFDRLRFNQRAQRLVIHVHCHAKSLVDSGRMGAWARRLPNRTVDILRTGCCGMAGGFGYLAAKYPLSLKIAEPLAAMVRRLPPGSVVIASGTSCRQQMEHLSLGRPRHAAEVLAQALESAPPWR